MASAERAVLTSDVVLILTSLGTTLASVRKIRGMSLREVGRATGLSFSTVTRVEQGEDCAVSSAIALLEWIGRSD